MFKTKHFYVEIIGFVKYRKKEKNIFEKRNQLTLLFKFNLNI